ncbi:hypothetical protein L596_016938 [Steinernema carpocapsae]|uniref:Uncharacterized protein n=1 Tax=Steinernema carpocapsae TaxID=34508 RepID=A0A4U5N0W1_STECR|nr:hypothetical protein L596_016938 [Steinernema carpocapsae]
MNEVCGLWVDNMHDEKGDKLRRGRSSLIHHRGKCKSGIKYVRLKRKNARPTAPEMINGQNEPQRMLSVD